MNSTLGLLYQFAPIVAGIAFFLAIKSINLIKTKVQIATPQVQDIMDTPIIKEQKPNFTPDTTSAIKDFLIINGILPKMKSANLYNSAIKNAGIATYQDIRDISKVLKHSKAKKLTIILNDTRLVSRILTNFDANSGILLAYNLDKSLEIVNQCT